MARAHLRKQVYGQLGNNVYEVNPWLWQFGRGKPRLGGLTIEETSERKDAVSNALHKRATDFEQRQYVMTRRLQPDSKNMVLYDSIYEYARVYPSMYENIRECTSMYQYNQGLQIFMICSRFCTYLFVISGSNIQCDVLRRCISAFINNDIK